MRWTVLAAVLLGDFLLLAPKLAYAQEALWLQPSTKWYGIDGNWSSFDMLMGSPGQLVSLTVSTALSEIWVIESSGCPANPLCTTARGGVFDITASASWMSLGAWQLGLKDLGLGGNGDYGLDTILVSNTVTRITTSVDGALIAVINDTDYYQGFIGVGVTQGRFGTKVVNPYITQLAESYGTIPSHSYGYTAGAYYVGSGVPASLTLGGYDSLRFLPHDITFNLNPNSLIPQVFLRGVTASVPAVDNAPTRWNSTTWPLVGYNVSSMALIDTSTPYLWLPAAMCDNFAAALNLTWSEAFGVYLFASDSQYSSFQSSPLSFTFSLTSFDNTDNFGQPLSVPGVVNITVPAAAFAQLLRYPFKNQFNFGDPAVPYFPLKRSDGDKIILGRAFMQEAYMIMSYDKQTFSVHQALFPDSPYKNYSLVDMERPPNSIYPAPATHNASTGLSTGAIVGIVVCALLLSVAVGLATWCCCFRRRKQNKDKKATREMEVGVKEDESEEADQEEQPSTPVERILSMIRSRRRPRRRREVSRGNEVSGDNSQPVEIGADSHHEVYELPAPLEPAELDSNDPMSTDEITDLGTEGTQGLSAYEIARRKLDRQLQGPVPEYSPPAAPIPDQVEKSDQDISPVAHYRPSEDPSPVSSPTYGNNSNSMPSIPSPMTPHPPDWATRHFDLPSPMTVAPPFPSPHFPNNSNLDAPASPHSVPSPRTYDPPSMSRSNSSQSPGSPGGSSLVPPSPTYQKAPIEPSRIICLGPLPENVRLPPQRSIPRIVAPTDQTGGPSSVSPVSPGSPGSSASQGHRRRSTETLGSNFTVEEETRFQEEMTRQQSNHQADGHNTPRTTPQGQGRIDTSLEIIHVPQLAEKRYSWEDER